MKLFVCIKKLSILFSSSLLLGSVIIPSVANYAVSAEEIAQKVPITANIYVENQSEQTDAKNPTYTILVGKTGLSTKLTKDNISFKGAFQKAKIVSVKDESENYKITITKDISNQKSDGFSGSIIISNNQSVALHDDYIYIPVSRTRMSSEDVSKKATSAAKAMDAFSQAAAKIDFEKLSKIMGYAGTAMTAVSVVFSVLAFFDAPEDPVLKELTEINRKLADLSNQVTNEADEIRNKITKTAYVNYINAIFQKYSDKIGPIMRTPFESIRRNLINILEKSGVDKANFGSNSVGDYIKDNEDGINIFNLLDLSFRGLYYYDRNGEDGMGYYNENNYNTIISYLDYLDGSAQPLSGGDDVFGSANMCKIFNDYASIQYDWNNQTFADRETFNRLTKQQVIELSSNLEMSLRWALSRNQQNKIDAEEQKTELLKVDPNANNSSSANNTTYNELTSKISLLADACTHIEKQMNILDTKVNNIINNTILPADKKLDDEKAQFNNTKTGIVYNYRIGKTFNRYITVSRTADAAWGYNQGSADVRNLTYHPANTWSEGEFDTINRAAQIRNTSVATEIASFDSGIYKDYNILTNKSRVDKKNDRTAGCGKIYYKYYVNGFKDDGSSNDITEILSLSGWEHDVFSICDELHKDGNDAHNCNFRVVELSATQSVAPVF